MKRDTKNVEELLKQHLPRPSQEIMESNRDLVWRKIGSQVDLVGVRSSERKITLRWKLMAAAAAVFAGVMMAVLLVNTRAPMAKVEVADGSLYRGSGDKAQALHSGDSIYRGEVIHANGGAGSVLELADGSRVEMRSQTDLVLERAGDGVRIRLSKGGVIVNAARQLAGHLYVVTKDVSVSVVGTVFLVNAEEQGSRVAVIEGEVRVETKETAEKLLPGQQVATNPAMESRLVSEEISWSRNAEVHLALLQLSAASAGAPEKASPERFETISIRPTPRGPVGVGRGGGGDDPRGVLCFPPIAPAPSGSRLQLDPARLRVTLTTLHALISAAYGLGRNCNLPISGEAEWARSESYDVEATMPPGFPAYSRDDLATGNAPKLQQMLQNLLADRFKLSIRREKKEVPAYNLIVVKPAKWECPTPSPCYGLKLSENQAPEPEPDAVKGSTAYVAHTTLSSWTEVLTGMTEGRESLLERPVVDMTGLKGFYDIRLEFSAVRVPPAGTPEDERRRTFRDLFFRAIQDQLGLKFEPTRTTVEVLVIDHAEKPSGN